MQIGTIIVQNLTVNAQCAMYQKHCTTDGVETQANETAKEWQENRFTTQKRASKEVARRMERIGLEGRGQRMDGCGDYILLAECPTGDHRHLAKGNYCRDRLCPQCMASKAHKQARELAAECMTLERRRGDRRPSGWLLVTLTTPNVPGKGLADEVQRQLQAWRDMARKITIQSASLGWVRRMEITFNAEKRTHHVHIHALIATVPGYFDPSRGLYITQKKLQAMWARELGVDLERNHLVVDIRAVTDREKVVAEVSKYVTKVMEYMGDDREFANLAAAIKGRNIMQYGGELRKIRKELGHTERGGESLDEVTTNCPVCGTRLEQVFYAWMGLESRYERVKQHEK